MPATRLERQRLANGLRVVLLPDGSLPLVAVNLWYHVGSKHERPGRTGFAHLFEHMLFQGSAHVAHNDHFRLIQQVGGVANGSTWYDRTNYYETLPANHLELGLWLESDRMGFLLPAMTEEKLENQRSVVMNERRQRVDNQPYGRASERLHELLYPSDHPYHWPVIGYMEDIAAATLDDVKEFFRTYYTPNNAVLTLVGDFDPREALDRVEAYFAALPRGPEPTPPIATPDPGAAGSGRRDVLEDDVRLPRVYLAFVAPPFGEPGWHVGRLLATLLSEGKSSRLYQDLVYERRIAQRASAYLLPTEECATFALVATGKPDSDVDELEASLLSQLDALAGQAPDRGELERAKNHLLTTHFGELQTFDHRADLLSAYTTYFDDPQRLWSEPEHYAGISGDEVSRFVQELCSPSAGVCLHVLPRQAA